MKLIIGLFTAISILFSINSFAMKGFDKSATKQAEIIQEGEGREWCPICGMKLQAYYKTNHAVKLKDGTKKQYCSIRCLAVDFPAISDKINEISVVAIDTEKLINVKEATYVIGSKIQGTMTAVSKLAFSSKEEAQKFQTLYGGELGSFEEAFAKAKGSLENDIAMTNDRKRKAIYPKGKKLYEVKCKEIDLMKFNNINELKEFISTNGICSGVSEESDLQPVALYLWEIKRFEHKHTAQIDVPERAKCPVCGMFVAKYPKWAAMIKHGDHNHYFDGAKDMFKYYFTPEAYGGHSVKDGDVKVSDYYTLEAIDAKKAYFVVGSDILGPMGHEFIPFKDKNSAESFSKDHKGVKILKFEEVKKGDSEKLDNGIFDF